VLAKPLPIQVLKELLINLNFIEDAWIILIIF
jgi:hypothetical protein